MVNCSPYPFSRREAAFAMLASLVMTACTSGPQGMNHSQLTDFATRYASAWSSQNPDSLASFYAATGSLQVNANPAAVGRSAVRATVQSFMNGFPDMIVRMDSVVESGPKTVFHWTWTGTNTGPGGTGKAVRISGYEEWTFDADGLIAQSLGHYDEAEYQRQMTATTLPPSP
jgi:predicted ester cyclase